MKKRLLIIILVIVFISFILLWFTWDRINIKRFMYSEKDQLNEIVSLVREKPKKDIEEVNLYIEKGNDFYSYQSKNGMPIKCNSKDMEKVLSILKNFKKRYGKHELDFDSIHIRYQGDWL